jgi:hypothetical protein
MPTSLFDPSDDSLMYFRVGLNEPHFLSNEDYVFYTGLCLIFNGGTGVDYDKAASYPHVEIAMVDDIGVHGWFFSHIATEAAFRLSHGRSDQISKPYMYAACESSICHMVRELKSTGLRDEMEL